MTMYKGCCPCCPYPCKLPLSDVPYSLHHRPTQPANLPKRTTSNSLVQVLAIGNNVRPTNIITIAWVIEQRTFRERREVSLFSTNLPRGWEYLYHARGVGRQPEGIAAL